MTDSSVMRLGLILAVQAEIEAMKLKNLMITDGAYSERGYMPEEFEKKAEQLRNLVYAHEQQL